LYQAPFSTLRELRLIAVTTTEVITAVKTMAVVIILIIKKLIKAAVTPI